jgi:hypothetical protein
LTYLDSAYIDEVENALKYIRETPLLPTEEKKRFFKNANTNMGLTALCLSGGATFAYCQHLGHAEEEINSRCDPQTTSVLSKPFLMRTFFHES